MKWLVIFIPVSVLLFACGENKTELIELVNNNGKFDTASQSVDFYLNENEARPESAIFGVDCKIKNGCDIVFSQFFNVPMELRFKCVAPFGECPVDLVVSLQKPDNTIEETSIQLQAYEYLNIGYLDMPPGAYRFEVTPTSWHDLLNGESLGISISAQWEEAGSFFCEGVYGECCQNQIGCEDEETAWKCDLNSSTNSIEKSNTTCGFGTECIDGVCTQKEESAATQDSQNVEFYFGDDGAEPGSTVFGVDCKLESGCDIVFGQFLDVPMDLRFKCVAPFGECPVDLVVSMQKPDNTVEETTIQLQAREQLNIGYLSLPPGYYRFEVTPTSWHELLNREFLELRVSVQWEEAGAFFCEGVYGECCLEQTGCDDEDTMWKCELNSSTGDIEKSYVTCGFGTQCIEGECSPI
jgi:hypothetical protein